MNHTSPSNVVILLFCWAFEVCANLWGLFWLSISQFRFTRNQFSLRLRSISIDSIYKVFVLCFYSFEPLNLGRGTGLFQFLFHALCPLNRWLLILFLWLLNHWLSILFNVLLLTIDYWAFWSFYEPLDLLLFFLLFFDFLGFLLGIHEGFELSKLFLLIFFQFKFGFTLLNLTFLYLFSYLNWVHAHITLFQIMCCFRFDCANLVLTGFCHLV